jgi:hypothetical protein
MRVVIRYLIFGAVAAGVVLFASYIDSNFLSEFFRGSLISLLIALLAINTTTRSLIMTRMRDIDGNPQRFARTIRSMRKSVTEHIALIAVAGLVLVVAGSESLACRIPYARMVADAILMFVTLCAVQILHDTASAMFVILTHEKAKNASAADSE